jgi:hypothetical protein
MEVAITGLRAGGLLVFLWLHTQNDPSSEEWDRAFALMTKTRLAAGIPLGDVRSFVVSDGGAPDGVQRARMGSDFPIKVSVITTVLSNPVKRGIATALSWINPRFFFTAPSGAKRAAEHLDLGDQWDLLWPAFLDLQEQMPPNRALALVAEVIGRPLA